MEQTVIYAAWENGESKRDRVLHLFSNHAEFCHFWSATDGLREWNPGARYPTRAHEIEVHNGNITIVH